MKDGQLKNKIVSHLSKKMQGLYGIYLYGSYAGEEHRKDSDIDIAILTREKLTSLEKWNLQEELASEIDKDVDLVDLKDASVILRVEVVEHGKRIYTGNQYECDNFETTTYSLYSDLNENRKDILKDYEIRYGRNSDK